MHPIEHQQHAEIRSSPIVVCVFGFIAHTMQTTHEHMDHYM